jgi:hypothetical protein
MDMRIDQPRQQNRIVVNFDERAIARHVFKRPDRKDAPLADMNGRGRAPAGRDDAATAYDELGHTHLFCSPISV